MISLPSYRFRFLGEWLFLVCCLLLGVGVAGVNLLWFESVKWLPCAGQCATGRSLQA